MLFAFLVLPHGSSLPGGSHFIPLRCIQQLPPGPLPLVWLACWLGNRPAGRSGAGARSPWRASSGRVASHSRAAREDLPVGRQEKQEARRKSRV